MKNEKTFAFQYATAPSYVGGEIFEDTDLITLEEAKALWEKYLPSFISELEDNNNPQMCIWKNMKNNCDYGDKLVYADKYVETDGKTLFEVIKREIKP